MVWILSAVATLVLNSLRLLRDILTFFRLCLRSPAAVAAKNLFLRKQLTLYIERKTKPRRATDSIRFTLARLSRFFDWPNFSSDDSTLHAPKTETPARSLAALDDLRPQACQSRHLQ